MKQILLDTSAYIKLFRGEQDVIDVLGISECVYMSVIVLGELYAGFKGGSKEKRNKKLLETFMEKLTVEILPVSKETSHIFGSIKYDLKRSGNPIPINDIWIASQTIETGAVMITYDTHFLHISGLRLWDELNA